MVSITEAPTTMISTQSSSLPSSTSQSIIETEIVTNIETSTSQTPSTVTSSFSTTQINTPASTEFLTTEEGKRLFYIV